MKKLLILLPLLALTACASMGGESAMQQQLVVKSQPAGADCTFTNNRGSWHAVTPDVVSVHRDGSDLQVYCAKGKLHGTQTVKYQDDPATYQYGSQSGLIGALIDNGTGAAYMYESPINVKLK